MTLILTKLETCIFQAIPSIITPDQKVPLDSSFYKKVLFPGTNDYVLHIVKKLEERGFLHLYQDNKTGLRTHDLPLVARVFPELMKDLWFKLTLRGHLVTYIVKTNNPYLQISNSTLH